MMWRAGKELSSTAYKAHWLHSTSRSWPETNCYADLWIELLHAHDLNPMAMLPFLFNIDFDGDQFTFYKPDHGEIFELYGIEVQELSVWRGLLENTIAQLKLGRIVLTEADAFYLPDTMATDYKKTHTKTTIGIYELNVAEKICQYFHNGGFFQLSGDDFVNTFRIDFPHDPLHMPFFAEVARLDKLVNRPVDELLDVSLRLLKSRLQRMPQKNPMQKFAQHLEVFLPFMLHEGMDTYHKYVFVSLRQAGSGFELASDYLKWLSDLGVTGLDPAIRSSAQISDIMKKCCLN